jgi:hypothetical protein
MLRGRTYNEQVDVYSYAMCLLEVVDGEQNRRPAQLTNTPRSPN